MELYRATKGLKKVIDAANLALSGGHEWIWIDTCCIDKTSSAELSEAINSMYRWYEDSVVCYVFLEDILAPLNYDEKILEDWHFDNDSLRENQFHKMLSQSRWVTRGWTLQEVIAPHQVHFHSGDWALIGKKSNRVFQRALSNVTGIDLGILSGQTTMAEISVANRMKWASRRQTTRSEDAAYCLMGIFAVNMPLLYGEGGQRSFIRLQEEILKATDDQSIFAWKLPAESNDDKTMFGLLANSPILFGNAPSTRTLSTEFQSATSVPWTMTNKGLQVQLYIQPVGDSSEEEYRAILDCCLEENENETMGAQLQGRSPSVRLRRLVGDQYTRIKARDCEWVPSALKGDSGGYESFFVKQNPSLVLPRLALCDSSRFKHRSNGWHLRQVFPSIQWSEDTGTFRFQHSRLSGIQAIFRFERSRGYLENVDIIIVLQQSARWELEVKYFASASEGNDLERTYVKLNRIWSAGPDTSEQSERTKWIQSSLSYQEAMRSVAVEMVKTVRAGRGLYLMNVWERFEYSELDGTSVSEFEMHEDSLEANPSSERGLRF
ncbi:hypothetical protein N0V82_006848 [Gnomoniopsis sp. IMI 355080]|nr:hypothetical protein N0V82_006848 [Gnomoniopsis sp. IMI 355080]